jgi:hypothetical protein
MLTGRRFKLREPVMATALGNDGERVAVIIPPLSVVEIMSATASGLRILDVLWDGKIFAMFAGDIAERGDELSQPSTEPRAA